ncbi:MAG: NUDIX hydrolase [Candidatus Moranbacteria bacterium]|nr:NUDIX hydrolase [Candidatus Moranbacteria bacterium]
MPKIIVASGPVIVENNKVLLDQHDDTDFWKFCGGTVENYETNLIENAKREAKEEAGIDLEILDRNPFIVFTRKETPEGSIDIILVHFLAKRIGEITPGDDIRQWKWLDIENIGKENLAPNIIPALEHFGFIKK